MTDDTARYNAVDYPEVTREHLGILPQFFIHATQGLGDTGSLDHVADAMDEIYGFGGFRFPFSGTVTDSGIYKAPEDPDLPWMAQVAYGDRFTMYVYPYAITAIRDNDTGETKIGRFD